MRRSASLLGSLVLAAVALASGAVPASANAVAGHGFSSSYVGESAFTTVEAGGSGQFSVIFFNDGTQSWEPGNVGLLVCAADKLSCLVPTPNADYASGWYSSSVYATVAASVAPGARGFFIYAFAVPASTVPGTAAIFNGEVGLIATGQLLRPQGYYHVNTVPQPLSLAISPTSTSMPLGTTQRFVATSPSAWTVTGGCGVISSEGIFAAIALNAPSQPCAVVARAGSLTRSAPVIVFGPAASLSCSASPASLVADGVATTVITAALKDANGNTVENATSPAITFRNITPTLGLMSPGDGSVLTPSAGAAAVTVTTTTLPGDLQVSATASGLIGCSRVVTSAAIGTPARTASTFLVSPLAADGTSTSILRVEIRDAGGNRVIGNSSIGVGIAASSAAACTLRTTSATVSAGRVDFTVTATTIAGTCTVTATPNDSSIAASSATLQTQVTGAASKLGVASNDSPHTAGASSSATTVAVDVQDASGNRVTSSTAAVGVALDAASCAGAPGGGVQLASAASVGADRGRATFILRSNGAYAGCALTFTSSGITSAGATIAFTPGTADHLSCAFAPTAIVSNGLSTATATVRVVDANNNFVTTGLPFSVTFSRTSGTSTTFTALAPRYTVSGSTTFDVRSSSTVGGDIYVASISAATYPTLPNPTSTGCTISVQSVVP